MAATDLEGTRGRIPIRHERRSHLVTHVVRIVNGKETDVRK